MSVYPETDNALAVIEVMDGSLALPNDAEAGPDTESGRGMAIVRELVLLILAWGRLLLCHGFLVSVHSGPA